MISAVLKNVYCSHPYLSMHGASSIDTPLWFIKMPHPYIPLLCCRLGKTNLFQNFPRPGRKLPQRNAAAGPDASCRAFESLQMIQSPETQLLPGTTCVFASESSWPLHVLVIHHRLFLHNYQRTGMMFRCLSLLK